MDIKTFFKDGSGYWQIVGPGFAEEDGLETAVIISLFSDRRAEADDILPDGGDDRRGYWGDAYAEIAGDLIGSRLWLLEREKQLPDVQRRAKEYADEALAWLVIDGVADRVLTTVERVGLFALGLVVEIYRPGRSVAQYRFDGFWKGDSRAI
jgi:phage gp46-like protein